MTLLLEKRRFKGQKMREKNYAIISFPPPLPSIPSPTILLRDTKGKMSFNRIKHPIVAVNFFNDALINTIRWIWIGGGDSGKKKTQSKGTEKKEGSEEEEGEEKEVEEARRKEGGKIFFFLCLDCAKSFDQNPNCAHFDLNPRVILHPFVDTTTIIGFNDDRLSNLE